MDKRDLRVIFWFAGVCFLASLIVSRLDLFVRPNPDYPQLASFYKFIADNTLFAVGGKMFISITTFTVLFKGFIGLFKSHRFWNLVHMSDSLNGDYVYIFEDTGIGAMIYGKFKIVHNMEVLRLTDGRCWYGGTKDIDQNNQRGTFINQRIGVGDYLWIPYEMTITNCTQVKESSYKGVMKLELQKDAAIKSLYLSGSLKNHDSDVSHSGRIQAVRVLKKDVARLKEFSSIPVLIKEYLNIDVDLPVPRLVAKVSQASGASDPADGTASDVSVTRGSSELMLASGNGDLAPNSQVRVLELR